MSRSLCHALLILLWCAALPLPVHAETKVLTAEATYTMGEGETMTFAEAMALQKAKQMALEQAGTYVESYAKVQNYQLTADEIQTIAGGVLQVEVLEKTRTLIGDGLKFFVKIKATVTTDKVAELAQRIKGKNVGEQYEKLQGEYARLTKEIETWKQLIAKTPPGPERDRALDQIREREKDFATIQRNETAFFQRVVAGKILVTQALEEYKKLQDVKKQLDELLEAIIPQGHSVLIGQPTAHAVANPSDLEVLPNRLPVVKVVVPVTLSVSGQLRLALERVAKKLGGSTRPADGRSTLVRVADAVEFQEYFLKRVRTLVLALHFIPIEGVFIQSCSIRNDAKGQDDSYLARLYPVHWIEGGGFLSQRKLLSYSYGSDPGKNLLLVDETPSSFRATIMLTEHEVRNLKSVSSHFSRETEKDPYGDEYYLKERPCGIE